MDKILFDSAEYINFLDLLISESFYLQNGGELVAEESRVANHVLEKLKQHIDNGTIKANKIEYVTNRANLIIEYGDTESEKSLTIAGSHFDVVPADPTKWERDPFKLIVEGDKLYGRGTTDCLGHIALVTLLLDKLATLKIKLNYKFIVVFIADEEVGKNPDIGVLHLQKDGLLEGIKNGPVYWLDAADVEPVLASGTGMAWELTIHGKKAHSGFPDQGINPIPIAMEASKLIISKFNELCPRLEKDTEYNFKTHSNMKPTMWQMPDGSSPNQYPDWVKIIGDVRMTPFYDAFTIKDQILQFAQTINLDELPKWHECLGTSCGEGAEETHARLEFKWVFGPYCGIACDNKSKGHEMIKSATLEHHGSCTGCSALGAVPLVKDMQDIGIDIQIIGYGINSAYHANNEFCTLSGMNKGFNILKSLLSIANE